MSVELRLENVHLRYGRSTALRDVNLVAGAGEAVGLVGPNGAGKTSIARLATGFTLPTRGLVTVGGMAARDYRLRHGVGYAPEELPRGWSCRVRALLAVRAFDVTPPAADFRDAVLRTLGVDALLDKRLPALSKGQWRAVLIAYALLARPGLAVLDEPDAGLDPGALDRLAELLAFVRQAGMTVLLLSHQLFEIERTCKRVLFVRDGTIVAEETAAAGGGFLRQRYKEVFT
ncbi:MAG TPA: ABC transporter ATP-binding protein [Longimicrobiales bacterium]|nr:ABC transporter ATP-binding protein [Longimicrobiales bacterium]